MKPAPFEYHAPASVDDVVSLLAEHGDDAKPLAGGQSLVPMLALRLTRFAHLVDLNRVDELVGVARDDGHVSIGAMTRQATVEHDPTVAGAVPLLHRVTPSIGHFQIRNRGTLGGSVAHADPASEYPVVALTLDAEMEVAGPGGRRTVPAADFFAGTWTTTLAPDELLVSVRFPAAGPGWGHGFEEVARRAGDFALAGACTAVEVGADGRVTAAAIGLLGLGATPLRAPAAEAALVGSSPGTADLAEIGRLAVADVEAVDDVHASASYRTRVGAHLVARTLTEALEEARRG